MLGKLSMFGLSTLVSVHLQYEKVPSIFQNTDFFLSYNYGRVNATGYVGIVFWSYISFPVY